MFEVIGIVVVAFISWQIISGMAKGVTKSVGTQTMSKAFEHARSLGVPVSALHFFNGQPAQVAAVRDILAANDPEFRMLDAHVQYGQAIAMSYMSMEDHQNSV